MSIPQHLQYKFKDGDALPSDGYIGPVVDRLITEHVAAGSRIIDIGCGNGSGSGYFAKRGFGVTGVDPSERGIAIARELNPSGDWFVEAAEPGLLGRIGQEPFDAAISVEVVEHVYAPREWASCCFECLRPGGVFVCTTPYHGYIKNLLLSLTDRWDRHMDPLWDGGHIKLWSRKTLSKLLTEAGFVDLNFYGAGRIPGLWMSMVMLARRPG